MVKPQNNLPLVSIIVITYNSSKYVIETLNSIKAQTYKNIELIISDDCSPDNTVQVIKQWLSSTTGNGEWSHQPKVVTTPKNGGICVNYNNGLKYASGKWIKYIAGDDILDPDCIESFVNVAEKSNDKLFICGTKPFDNTNTELPKRLLNPVWFSGDAKSQEKLLVQKGTIIEGPTLFLEKETLQQLGGFEEKYPFIEDYPLCMKYLKHGYRINLVEKHLIKYREYPESVSRSNQRFATSIYRAIDDYAIPAARRQHMYLYWWHYWVRKAIRDRQFPKPILYMISGLDIIHLKHKFCHKG